MARTLWIGALVGLSAAAQETPAARRVPPADRPPSDFYGGPMIATPAAVSGALSLRHDGPAAVAFSPDGRRLASAGTDGRVKLWCPASAFLAPSAAGEAGPDGWGLDAPLSAVAYSPDSSRIAFAGGDDRRRDFDVRLVSSGEPVRLTGAQGPILALAFSPDGELLAAGGADRSIQIWAPGALAAPRRLTGHEKAVTSLAFGDPGILWSAGADGSVRQWDLESGSERFRLMDADSAVSALTLSRDGRLLAAAGTDGAIRVWETLSCRLLMTITDASSWVSALAFRGDGRALAAGVHSGAVRILYLETGRQRVAPVDGWITSVAFSRDGHRLAIGGASGGVAVWPQGPDPEGTPTTSAADLSALWEALADPDPIPALRAVAAFRSDAGIDFLRARLAPLRSEDLARFLRQLDDEDLEIREQATQALERFGPSAAEALRQARERSPEARVRADAILKRLSKAGAGTPEVLRPRRAIQALEGAATPAARALLEILSRGTASAPETLDARNALRRIRP